MGTMTAAMIESRRRGGLTRARQFTAESQAAASRAQTSDSKRRAGKVGAEVTLQKHGAITLVEKLVAYRREHPSRPEQAGINLLTYGLGLEEVQDSSEAFGQFFEREVPVDEHGLLRLDLGNRYHRWGIEIRGSIHDWVGDQAHEAQRLATIEANGWSVMVIDEPDLVNSAGRARFAFGLQALVEGHIRRAIDRDLLRRGGAPL